MKEIPKQFNFKDEDEIYKLWEKSGFFNPDNLKGEPYSIMMPPPNVTGVLHLGHAWENTLMDVTARYQRMQGKKVLILPGTDHAAVATQAKVEKILTAKGIKNPREELGREKLLKEIRNYAEDSKATISKQIKKMGTSCDWSRLAYTFDEKRNRAVNEVFKKMYDDGLIYRGFRVINWSVKGQSTCSDDELVHVERMASFYTFKYSKDFPISISTTRPETKLGDTAVAVNPKDERYKKYIGQIFEVDVRAKKPLKIKIIADKNVDMNFGTGALGVTPAHSAIDFEMYEKQKAKGDPIDFIQVIDINGKMTENAGKDYEGLSVIKAREKFIDWLEKNNLLEKTEGVSQNVGTSDRFGDVVEALPMTQWFVDVNKKIPGRNKSLKDLMKEAVTVGHNRKASEKILINPDRFKKIYLNWIDNLRDWCISRQVWWGHRIPVWYCLKCEENYKKIKNNPALFKDSRGYLSGPVEYGNFQGKFIPDIEQIKREIEENDVRLNENLKPIISEKKPKKCPFCKNESKYLFQDSDTLDTWFSSGLWTFSTLGWPTSVKTSAGKPQKTNDLKTFHPTSWMQMGHEILFFWMARMILMSTYVLNEIPFRKVYIHGILRNEKGQKFSKSAGDNIDPLDVIEKYGTDALRTSLISGITPGNDSKFYWEKIESARNLSTKIWNIFAYAKNADNNFKLEQKISVSNLKSLSDKWIVSRLEKLIKETTSDLEKFNFSLAQEKLRTFTWNELADWYIEINKAEKNTKVLGYVLDKIIRLWHPFMPFLTEKIWQNLNKGKDLLMIQKWPENDRKLLDKKSEKEFNNLANIISKIRNVRSSYHIEPAKIITVYAKNIKEKGIIERLSRIKIGNEKNKDKRLLEISTPGFSLKIDIAEFIDISKELALIKKEIVNFENLIKKNESLLKNKNFAKGAPKEVVENNRQKLEEYKEKLKIQKELEANLQKIK